MCNKNTNKSDVWDYFSKKSNNTAACNLCGKMYKMGGGTTNLKNHLSHKHSTVLQKLRSPGEPKRARLTGETSETPVEVEVRYTYLLTYLFMQLINYCFVTGTRKGHCLKTS